MLDEPIAPATDPLPIGDRARGVVDTERAAVPDAEPMGDFVGRYQRLVAFARSIDIADYCQRHLPATPRTVCVSSTDHVTYDMWWLCNRCSEGECRFRAR